MFARLFAFCNLWIKLICLYAERVSIQNVMNTTKIWVNPPFKEAVKFIEGFV